jgi:hypothetical protein
LFSRTGRISAHINMLLLLPPEVSAAPAAAQWRKLRGCKWCLQLVRVLLGNVRQSFLLSHCWGEFTAEYVCRPKQWPVLFLSADSPPHSPHPLPHIDYQAGGTVGRPPLQCQYKNHGDRKKYFLCFQAAFYNSHPFTSRPPPPPLFLPSPSYLHPPEITLSILTVCFFYSQPMAHRVMIIQN